MKLSSMFIGCDLSIYYIPNFSCSYFNFVFNSAPIGPPRLLEATVSVGLTLFFEFWLLFFVAFLEKSNIFNIFLM